MCGLLIEIHQILYNRNLLYFNCVDNEWQCLISAGKSFILLAILHMEESKTPDSSVKIISYSPSICWFREISFWGLKQLILYRKCFHWEESCENTGWMLWSTPEVSSEKSGDSVYVCCRGPRALWTWSQIEDSHPVCINVSILEDAFCQSMGKNDFPQHK